MSTISAFGSGVQGIQKGFSNLRRDAHQIATTNKPDQLMDLTRPLVNLTTNRAQISANAKVIQTAGDMVKTIGSLLDVKA